MSKKKFFAPFLSETGSPTIDLDPSGGMTAQSLLIDTLVVELPDGTEVIANELGDILEELEPEVAETTELEVE